MMTEELHPQQLLINKLQSLKKGDIITFRWGCDADYKGKVIKNLKYKMVIETEIHNNRIHREIRDFAKEYFRLVNDENINTKVYDEIYWKKRLGENLLEEEAETVCIENEV